MGKTQLPMEVVLEYLESLKKIYTPESYDLFAHNCNNFTNDFGMFLVGKGIPEHITSLPQTVLNTPFGQMLKPQIDASMRSITQAPVPPPKTVAASSEAKHAPSQAVPAAKQTNGKPGPRKLVVNLTRLSELETTLGAANDSCAIVFFTSSTCAPCKIAYSTFDSLAAEHPRATFVKVDINAAHEIASSYGIRATPTFMTFLQGNKNDEWTGADPRQLRSKVETLVEQAFQHIHARVNAPTLRSGSLRPVSFSKIPPLDKLVAKMGTHAKQVGAVELKHFLELRTKLGEKEAPLPAMKDCATFLQQMPVVLPAESLFTAYDLLRCALLDPRVSGWFAEESAPQPLKTLIALLEHVTSLLDSETCPYNLRLVAIQLSCNLFTSPLSTRTITSPNSPLTALLVQLTTSSLLSEPTRPAVRAAAASLALNLATAHYRVRREEDREALSEAAQTELAVALLEALSLEEAGAVPTPQGPTADGKPVAAAEPLQAALLAFGYLLYYAPVDGELFDLCKVMDARSTVETLKGNKVLRKIAGEVLACLPVSEQAG